MLTTKDTRIIRALRTGARQRLGDLAQQTGIPLSTLHERMQNLHNNGKIRLVSIPSFPALQLPLHLWVFLQTKRRDAACTALSNTPYTNTVLRLSNGADVAAECVFPTFKAQHEFLQTLREFGTVHTYPVIDAIGRELFLAEHEEQKEKIRVGS